MTLRMDREDIMDVVTEKQETWAHYPEPGECLPMLPLPTDHVPGPPRGPPTTAGIERALHLRRSHVHPPPRSPPSTSDGHAYARP
jgi:hypothetical protein